LFAARHVIFGRCFCGLSYSDLSCFLVVEPERRGAGLPY
jgi:hypothetical protein